MNLFSKEAVLAELQKEGIWSKKKLGQHFLVDQKALDTIVATADLHPGEQVVEIGPGMGVLSQALLQAGVEVTAFEYDQEMVALLKKRLPALKVIAGDVLRTAPEIIPRLGEYKVVANIPYQITTPILKVFLEGQADHMPKSMTLLVQKEVGRRLAAPARSSERGYLSVLAQYLAEVSYVATVPAEAFWPAPKVDSGIIHLKRREKVSFALEESVRFLKFVRMLYINPRKQLKNVVAGILSSPNLEIEATFRQLGFPANVRAQELTQDEWETLYKALKR